MPIPKRRIIRPGQRHCYRKGTRQQIDQRRGFVARALAAGATKTEIHRAVREKFNIQWRQTDRYIAWLAHAGREQCDRMIAALLAIFLGAFGIHQFYLGKSQLGLIYIVFGIVTCTFGFFLTAVVGLIEGIIYMSMTQADFERKYVDSPAKNYLSGFQNKGSPQSGKLPLAAKLFIGFIIFIFVCMLIGLVGAALSNAK